MLFSYKAVKKGGEEYEGTLEAADKFALYKELHTREEAVLWVKAKSVHGKLHFSLSSISFGGTKMVDRIMFAKNLSAMLKAGLPLARGLSVLERQMSGKAWKTIFVSVQDDLSKGITFSASLAKFPKTFSSLFISMTAAGEESGSFSDALSLIAGQLEKSYQLQKKVRGAMLYPIIILGLMAAIGVLMFIYVVPKLTQTFREFNVALPLPTRIILGVSDFIFAHYILLIVSAIALVIGYILFAKSAFGKKVIHKAILILPVIGPIAKQVNSARTTRTLSSLLSSGVSIVAAIKITSSVVQNVHYKALLDRAADDIQKGSTLQSLFLPRADLFPSFVGEMIGVGEETGTLSKTMLEVASFYENEVEQKTKDISTIIEPVLMIFIGLGVGFFALAIISPIYSLSSNI